MAPKQHRGRGDGFYHEFVFPDPQVLCAGERNPSPNEIRPFPHNINPGITGGEGSSVQVL